MTTFDRISEQEQRVLNQSILDEQNRENNRSINTSQSVNVSNLFKKIQGFDDKCDCAGNNCADGQLIKCLQCYQCNFKYCQECLCKVISEFHKCAQCSANLINNYNKIEEKNKQLINEINKKKNQQQNNQFNNQSKNQIQNKNQNQFNNVFYLDYLDEMEQIKIATYNSFIEETNRNISNEKNRNISNISNNKSTSNKSRLEIYNEELRNNEILPYKLSSSKNIRLNPNFDYTLDFCNKLHIFTAHDKHLPNIEIKYKIFDTTFLKHFHALLIYLINEKNIEYKFNNIWIKIYNTIQEFYKISQTKNSNKQNELLFKINTIINE